MRPLEGIAAAKVKGVYTGRKPSIAADQVRRLAANGMGGTAIARELKIAGRVCIACSTVARLD